MRTPRLALAPLFLVLAAAPAGAAWFDRFDVDADGVLGEAEFRDALGGAGVFERWDADDDGLIGEDEFAAGIYASWDTDDDGRLSVAEWDRSVDRWFGEADVNLSAPAWDDDGDGVISPVEFQAALERTDLFDRVELDEDPDELIGEDELAEGLFGLAEPEADALGDDDDAGFLADLFDDGLFEEDAPDGIAAEEPIEIAEPETGSIIEAGEPFVQLPIPCGPADGEAAEPCAETAARFCEALGYEPPIAHLAVRGELYVIRCRDDPT